MPNDKPKIHIQESISDFKKHLRTKYKDVEVNNEIAPQYNLNEYDLYIIVPSFSRNGVAELKQNVEKVLSQNINEDKIIILFPNIDQRLQHKFKDEIKTYLTEKRIKHDDLGYDYHKELKQNIFGENTFLDQKINEINKRKENTVCVEENQPKQESQPKQENDKLKSALDNYIQNRQSRMGNFLRAKWFPWGSESSKSKETKLLAAHKVHSNEIEKLTKKEIKALQDGELGKIINADNNVADNIKKRLNGLKQEVSESLGHSSNLNPR